jgi:hypothetical protein
VGPLPFREPMSSKQTGYFIYIIENLICKIYHITIAAVLWLLEAGVSHR